MFAARSYRFTGFELGVRAEDLLEARASEATENQILDASLRAYAAGIRENRVALHHAMRQLRSALRALWMGLAVLAGATGILMVMEVAI